MRPPARFLVVLACLLALAGLSACGSDSGSGSALDNSLGYLPKDAPFAVAVDTDVDGTRSRTWTSWSRSSRSARRSATAC